MKAIEFEGHNVVIAKDQPQYQPLPAFVQDNGMVTYCMELSEEELNLIKKTKEVKLSFLNFGQVVQPVRVSVNRPEFPISKKENFVCNATQWREKDSIAILRFPFNPDRMFILKKSKLLWITVVTYGQPLQPISMVAEG